MRFIPVDEKKKAETLAFLAKYERFGLDPQHNRAHKRLVSIGRDVLPAHNSVTLRIP